MPEDPNASDVLPTYPDLAGKTAVVTGAAMGMGSRFTETLLRCGVRVYAADIQSDMLHEFASAVDRQGDINPIIADVSQQSDVEALSAAAISTGRLDIWVNNAATFPGAPAAQISTEQWRRTMQVNLDGVFYGAQAAAKHMVQQGSGSIINMGSVAAFKARLKRAHYGTAKAGVEHLTHCLAAEWGPSGVRVNGISPGFIDTAMTDFLRSDPSAMESALQTVPLRRLGGADEVARVLLFLASDTSSFVNGHVISVDGGARYI